MNIEHNLARYVVFAEAPILDALAKMTQQKQRFIFSVTASGHLEGVVTDGDIRRWLVEQEHIDLTLPIARVSNKKFVSASVDEDPETVAQMFSEVIEFVPLLDGWGHLVAVAHRKPRALVLGGFTIGSDSPAFLISEIGNNHNGDVELAHRLVDLAADAGAQCVKFQMRSMSSLYRNRGRADSSGEDLGAEYTLDLLARFNLPAEQLYRVFDHCRSRGVVPLCTPWDLESVANLERYGIEGYKIASADLTNHDLLEAVAATRKPLLLSTGMSRETEIIESVKLLQRRGAPFMLLHCNSTYPTPFKDVNLAYMDRLRDIGQGPVGYSGHERGFAVCIAAVARGAKVIEKHFTIDRDFEGSDHKISLLPGEFADMVAAIRATEEAMGSSRRREITQGELMNRENLAKSLVAACDIPEGEVIAAPMLAVKSPGRGLQPNRRHELIGRRLRRPVAAGDFFYPSDLEDQQIQPRAYRFGRPWGVPVRYHDSRAIRALVSPDFLEYHLSYKDMDLKLEDWFDAPVDMDFTVHCPELFAGDHVVNLCSDDQAYRQRSIDELNRVCDVARALRPWHAKAAARTLIVTNMGGFSEYKPIDPADRARLYDMVLESLRSVDTSDVEIIPQTMPPFPWHFGGQRFHNLFVDPQEIADICHANGMRICLDVSHSQLACNHFGWSMSDFVRLTGPVTAHLHIADAAGVDGEGLQIGEGTMDFRALGDELNRDAPAASFIPEVWQGHKNNGEGFWIALDRLEGKI
ncbi:MAG: N-acetylneuraminate synthase family protein [Actinomycetota bacterium]